MSNFAILHAHAMFDNTFEVNTPLAQHADEPAGSLAKAIIVAMRLFAPVSAHIMNVFHSATKLTLCCCIWLTAERHAAQQCCNRTPIRRCTTCCCCTLSTLLMATYSFQCSKAVDVDLWQMRIMALAKACFTCLWCWVTPCQASQTCCTARLLPRLYTVKLEGCNSRSCFLQIEL